MTIVSSPSRSNDITSVTSIVWSELPAYVACAFVVSDFNRLPKFGPEEVNLAAVVERQVRLEGTIQHLSSTVQAMAPLQALTP